MKHSFLIKSDCSADKTMTTEDHRSTAKQVEMCNLLSSLGLDQNIYSKAAW
jgi:hypothetical protein